MSGTNRTSADRSHGPGGSSSAQSPPTPERGQHSARGSRGQTTLDFAIGISLFLSVMLFVFAFVPGILQPFNLSGEQDTVLSERIASKLSQGMLGDPDEPYVLHSHCTVSFFEEGASSPGYCTYDGSSINERLGLADYRNVNVSIEGNLDGGDPGLVCWEEGTQQIVERDSTCPDSSGDQLLVGGETVPTANDATVTSRRVVSLHGQNVTMKVVVW